VNIYLQEIKKGDKKNNVEAHLSAIELIEKDMIVIRLQIGKETSSIITYFAFVEETNIIQFIHLSTQHQHRKNHNTI
jgi:hypothetical protein